MWYRRRFHSSTNIWVNNPEASSQDISATQKSMKEIHSSLMLASTQLQLTKYINQSLWFYPTDNAQTASCGFFLLNNKIRGTISHSKPPKPWFPLTAIPVLMDFKHQSTNIYWIQKKCKAKTSKKLTLVLLAFLLFNATSILNTKKQPKNLSAFFGTCIHDKIRNCYVNNTNTYICCRDLSIRILGQGCRLDSCAD